MLDPIVAVIAILVAAAIMAVGFIYGISLLVTAGMVLMPLAVLSGVPMWKRRNY